MSGDIARSKSRVILIAVLAVVLIPVIFVGGCLTIAVVAGILNYGDELRDQAAAGTVPVLSMRLSGRILFIAQADGTDDLYVVNVDGSSVTRLTHNPSGSLMSTPALSPDRSRLAMSSVGVTIIPIDRPAETVRLDRPKGWLAWSPDGRQLASLSLDDQKRFRLYVFNADGSGEARDMAGTWPPPTPADQQSVAELTWSPDGRHLAFVYNAHPGYKRSGPRYNHLYVAAVDRDGLRNASLEPNAVTVAGGLAWSPDSQRLAFGSGHGIGLLDAELKWSEIPVPVHESRAPQLPSWSPDGRFLAWFNPNSIVISDPTGNHQQELTRGRCRGVQPSWAADGIRLAFVCHQDAGSELFVMNADGSGLTKVTSLNAGKSWIDRGTQLRNPIWLRDAR